MYVYEGPHCIDNASGASCRRIPRELIDFLSGVDDWEIALLLRSRAIVSICRSTRVGATGSEKTGCLSAKTVIWYFMLARHAPFDGYLFIIAAVPRTFLGIATL